MPSSRCGLRLDKLKTIMVAILVLGALSVAPPHANATPIAPGGTVAAVPIAFPGGTELDSVFYANVGLANLIVDVGASVLRNAAGTLDFYYQVTNDSAGNQVHLLTGSDFSGFVTDVWWVLNGAAVPCAECPSGSFTNGTQDPLTVDRDAFGEIGFSFPTPGFEVDPGEASVVLLIQTNATAFEPGVVSVIGDGGTVTRPAFQPGVSAVPERASSASLLLLSIGLLGTGATIHRKRKA